MSNNNIIFHRKKEKIYHKTISNFKRPKMVERAGMILSCLILYEILMQEISGALATITHNDVPGEFPICLYSLSDQVSSPDDFLRGKRGLDNETVLCSDPADYCFSFFQIKSFNISTIDEIDLSEHEIIWHARGCFRNAHICLRESCEATEGTMENFFFCCCKGNRCNERITFKMADNTTVINEIDLMEDENSVNSFPWTLLFVFLSCFLIMISVCSSLTYLKFFRKQNQSNTSMSLQERSSSCTDLSNVTLLEIVGKGTYGTVHRALLNDMEVAVKLFPLEREYSYRKEQYIYSLPLMEHENLLSYLCGGKLEANNTSYFGLVLSYCNRGSLCSFLRENTLDWTTFCRVAATATRGLEYLHYYVKKGDEVKPCLVHQDFNTRNILLKADMTCVVSDLGNALHVEEYKFYRNGEECIAAKVDLAFVGTLRYMAPEVLEGAVNLHNCEAALKQIDVYALGLVLWEISSRCHDLYQGTQTPSYALPFEKELGLLPSIEQMRIFVGEGKMRPEFPQIWDDSNPVIQRIKETINDCWEEEAEARLSAMCVENRLYELPKLWNKCETELISNNEFQSYIPLNNFSECSR